MSCQCWAHWVGKITIYIKALAKTMHICDELWSQWQLLSQYYMRKKDLKGHLINKGHSRHLKCAFFKKLLWSGIWVFFIQHAILLYCSCEPLNVLFHASYKIQVFFQNQINWIYVSHGEKVYSWHKACFKKKHQDWKHHSGVDYSEFIWKGLGIWK